MIFNFEKDRGIVALNKIKKGSEKDPIKKGTFTFTAKKHIPRLLQ